MSYIKYGIVTKINIEKDKNFDTYIKSNFNLKLYEQKEKYYVIKEKIVNKNIKDFRKEILVHSNNNADSINSCEAYCLNTNAEDLLKNKIIFIEEDDKYYFENHEDFVFEFEKVYYFTEKICLKLNFLSLFWDINSIEINDFLTLNTFLNNIAKKALNNCLKDASLFIKV